MIIAVTGQMRSGTSAVAEVLHFMGCPMAVHTPAPIPPQMLFDWEDSELSIPIMAGDRLDGGWYDTYFDHRLRMAEKLFGSGSFGLKSPYLVFHAKSIEKAARRMGEKVTWVVLDRRQKDIDASMEACKGVLRRADNEAIGGHLNHLGRSRTIVNCEALVASPESIVPQLAERLGLDPTEEALQRAISRINKPVGVS